MAHERFSICIEACNDCADACDHCATACLGMPEANERQRCIALDIDCAALCRLAAGFMARGSDMAPTLCEACADVCEACAAECSQYEDEYCKRCAEACRRCADECRKMAGGTDRAKQSSGSAAHPH